MTTILCDHLRDVLFENIFKLNASAAASEFCEWLQVGIDVYIPHRKYQAEFHSSPWFSAACAAVTVHRNHFFVCTEQVSSESKVKFRRCKGVLEAAKLIYVKQKSPSFPRNLALGTFHELLIMLLKVNLLMVLNKCKSAILPVFSALEVLFSVFDKAKLFATFFLRTLILMTQVFFYLFPILEQIRNCIIFSLTLEMVKKVIRNLDLYKAVGPDCILVVVLKNGEPELSMRAEFFNISPNQSCFPDYWKVSSVIAVKGKVNN